MRELVDLTPLYDLLKIPEIGRRLVETIRHSEPERRVEDGAGNVCGAIPDDRMGGGIQYESRTVERRFPIAWRFDPGVIEYWDQPTTLNLSYHNKAGRRLCSSHRPDYLLIANSAINFIECKPPAKLADLSSKYPDRFTLNSNGRWVSPAGEIACAPYGIGYQVALPSDIPAIFVRNADFLIDYLRELPDQSMEAAIDEVCRLVVESKVIRLDRLLESAPSSDAVYFAITQRRVHFRMTEQLLCRPEVSYVFESDIYAEGLRYTLENQATSGSVTLDLEIGVEVIWDGKRWRIVNFGEATYSLVDEGGNIARLREMQIAELVRDGHMSALKRERDGLAEAQEILLSTSPQDLAEGVRKAKILDSISKGVKENVEVAARTIREWQKDMKEAFAKYGNAFIGLLGRTSRRGWRGSHLNDTMDQEIARSIDEDYLTPSPRDATAAYRLYKARCKEKGVPSCSYETYRTRIKQIQETHRLERRHGRKMAYQSAGPLPGPACSSDVLPTHGDRFLELTHADHTELPIDLVSAITGQVLGRPWLSVLLDAYTRVVLAYFITFEPPSYRALMMLFRECVRRYGRLPSKCITDWGPEFKSIYFEALLTSHFVERMHREAGEPRYGSLIEKINATTQTQFVKDLLGNTTNLVMARSLSSSHYPEHHAVWTPDAFDDRLGQWFYEIYPNNPHLGINERPADRMQRSLASIGTRKIRLITYNESFIRETLPAPERETRCIKKGTIKVNHVPYVGTALDDTTLWGDNVSVRYDPYDISYVYAFVKQRWERLRTNNQLILDYTEREIRMAHMEVYARCRDSYREYIRVPEQMLQFLRDVHNQERHLLALRKYNIDRQLMESKPAVVAVARARGNQLANEPVPMHRRGGKGGRS